MENLLESLWADLCLDFAPVWILLLRVTTEYFWEKFSFHFNENSGNGELKDADKFKIAGSKRRGK